jgi:TonB-linked SusC/RagA family outer membrane protein
MKQSLQKGIPLLSFFLLFGLTQILAGSTGLAQQTRAIKGKVTSSEGGETIPGVSILVEGTTQGTQTDADGNFALEVADENAVLVFSSIGFKPQEVLVKSRTTIDVALEVDITTLSEIVVIGYGTQDRRDVTGSVSSVKPEKLKSMPVVTVSDALQGRAAGVQVLTSGTPGTDATLIIRGLGSINGTAPLVVIDGFPTTSGINTINPNDVESIEVLKDASATAIYGSRAANGVVIITTKKGSKNSAGFNIDFFTGIQQPTNLTEMMDASQFAQLNNEMMSANGQPVNPDYADPSSLGEGTDWLDAMVRSAPKTSLSLSYSGGNEKSSYHVSGNVVNHKGIIINNGYKRYSLQFNGDHQVLERLKFGHTLTLNHDIKTSGNYNVRDAMAMVPVQPVYKEDGTYSDPLGNPLWYGGMNNPVGQALVPENTTKGYNLIGSIYGEFEIVDGLTFRSNAGVQANFWDTKNWNPKYDWHPTPQALSYLGVGSNKNLNWLWDNTITYKRNFLEKHDITLLGGVSAQENTYSNVFAVRQGFASPLTKEINAGSRENLDNGGTTNEWALLSFFGRMNYSFDDRYLLTATIRRDGSSRFGRENRFGTFPSFSAAWRISNENFFEGSALSFFDDLKLRAGYGETGSQEIGLYQYASSLVTGQYNFNGQLVETVYPLAMANPAIQWEAMKQSNVALDMSMINSRLNLTVEGFVKNTDNMLVNAAIPISTGYNPGFRPPVNAGTMQNRGIELTIESRNVQGAEGRFTWSTDFNFTFLQNKIVSLNDTVPISTGGIGLNYNVARLQNGHAINSFYGHVTNGLFQTQEEVDAYAVQTGGSDIYNRTSAGDIRFRDLNNDGVINDDDRTFIGNPNPKFIFALNNTFAYKNFDLNIFIQGEYDKDIFNANLIWQESMGTVQNQTTRMTDRWVGEGTSTNIPRAVFGDPNKNARPSNRFVEDGSYVRIKNVALGYNLPAAIARRAAMTRARIYVSAQNLFTFTNYSGNDPELSSATGIDLSVYPQAKTFTVGANLSF